MVLIHAGMGSTRIVIQTRCQSLGENQRELEASTPVIKWLTVPCLSRLLITLPYLKHRITAFQLRFSDTELWLSDEPHPQLKFSDTELWLSDALRSQMSPALNWSLVIQSFENSVSCVVMWSKWNHRVLHRTVTYVYIYIYIYVQDVYGFTCCPW